VIFRGESECRHFAPLLHLFIICVAFAFRNGNVWHVRHHEHEALPLLHRLLVPFFYLSHAAFELLHGLYHLRPLFPLRERDAVRGAVLFSLLLIEFEPEPEPLLVDGSSRSISTLTRFLRAPSFTRSAFSRMKRISSIYNEHSMLAPIRQLEPADYPAKLREIPDPPGRLWMLGSWAPAGTKYLAVVGSRALSRYGKEACEKLVAGLAGYPISIVSGLALGADACAHRTALSVGLHTVAIPGSGLNDNVISPRSNHDLARDILNAGGALISEQEPAEPSRAQYFPSRNRIMVGISDAVLVIEAYPP
jgi:DNA protecting protein DprA